MHTIMISISKIKLNKTFLFLFACALFLGGVVPVWAQNSMTLSISPSLYDISIEPGQEWRSTLKLLT